MKKTVCLLCAITMLFMLCSCKERSPQSPTESTDSSIQSTIESTDSSALESTQYVSEKTYISKDYVPEFMELLGGERELGGLLSHFVLDGEHCYNVTPPQVAAETDMKIFKFSDSCISLVLLDNNIYTLCMSFGGYGFVNAVPCDFDQDGNKDLLVASSWGSGLHRSEISVFNSVTKEFTVIYDTSSTINPNTDLFVAAVLPALSHTNAEEIPVSYQVYSADITVNDMENYNLADLSYAATDLVGSIELEDGKPTFVPHKK